VELGLLAASLAYFSPSTGAALSPAGETLSA
jgi:hypothetical protein